MSSGAGPGERGSILMETIMVLPLYVVMIGGIFWVGELCLAKNKLVMADRYAAWNAGNRHRVSKGGIQSEIQNTYFRKDEVGEQPIQMIGYEAWDPLKWSNPVGAVVLLTVFAPEWTKGWLAGSPGWPGVKPPPNSAMQQGRNAKGQLSQHVVFMRNRFSDYAYRSPYWTPKQLADWSLPWLTFVYEEEWPKVSYLHPMDPQSLIVQTVPPAPPGYLHTRHPAYVDWAY
jgi:hypothetical protein